MTIKQRIKAESSVEYPCEITEVHSPKRQDRFKTNLKIKRQQGTNKGLESTNSFTKQVLDQVRIEG